MTVYVGPGTIYEAVFEAGVTGLAGTVALGLLDNQGTVTAPLDTAGIIETPAGSGVYAATRTSPTVAGQFTLLWSLDGTTDPDQVTTEELFVSSSLPIPDNGSYATKEELAAILQLGDAAPAYADALQRVLDAATKEIDAYLDRDPAVPFTNNELQLVTEVNLNRAVDLWKRERSPYALIGLGGDSPAAFVGRNSWREHANTLRPLKQRQGIA